MLRRGWRTGSAEEEEEALTDAVIVPTWAIALFASMLGILLAVIRWSLIRFTTTVDGRLENVEKCTRSIDRRLIVVETLLNDGGGTDPQMRRLRVLTPTGGVPQPPP
jgi:hypothetical protein